MTEDRRKVLVVEDEALVADMLVQILNAAGIDVIGPVGAVSDALKVAGEPMMAAFLDVNLRGERIDPVAQLLKARNIPLVFTTGYGHALGSLGEGATILTKPYTEARVRNALSRILAVQA